MTLGESLLCYYMGLALEVAVRGAAFTNNGNSKNNYLHRPYVGAIVVPKQGDTLFLGYRSLIDPTKLLIHAERMALDNAGKSAKEGILFVTLEPCIQMRDVSLLKSCSELIVERGIETVVYGINDSNMRGEGVKYLTEHGVKVMQYQGFNEEITRFCF